MERRDEAFALAADGSEPVAAPAVLRAARRIDWCWWFILGIAAVDAALLATTEFRLAWRAEVPIVSGSALLGALWLVYGRLRPRPQLSAFARTGLLYAVYTDVAAVLSYLLTGLSPLPLLDPQLAAVDSAMGLDWLAWHRAFAAAPSLWLAAQVIYHSLGLELIALIVLFDPMRRSDRARELFVAFAISSFAVIVLGALLPAAGAFVEYGTPEAQRTGYVLQYLGLRDGSLRTVDLRLAQGLVQFPSFHAALAVLCVYVVRGMRWLFWPLLLLDTLVVLTTPTVGGHHFADVFAGLALAAAVIFVLRRRKL